MAKVHSIEMIAELAKCAADALARLGNDNVKFQTGIGAHGWPEHASFENKIVTDEAAEIPKDLINQPAPEGRLIMTVGEVHLPRFVLANKRKDGTADRRVVLPVPLHSPG